MYTSCMRVLLFHSLHISPQSWIRMPQCSTYVLYGCRTACLIKVCRCVRVVLSGCGTCSGTMEQQWFLPCTSCMTSNTMPFGLWSGVTSHVTSHCAEFVVLINHMQDNTLHTCSKYTVYVQYTCNSIPIQYCVVE